MAHHGDSTKAGHYTYYVYGKNDHPNREIHCSFIHFDDLNVEKVQGDSVEVTLAESSYIIVYRLKDCQVTRSLQK